LAPALTETDVETYRRDGFLVVRGLFDRAECDAMRVWADDLARASTAPGGARWYSDDQAALQNRTLLSRVEYFRNFHPPFKAAMESPRVLDALALLLGEPAVLFKDKINYKIPGSSGFETHQDAQAGWNRYCATQITALVSIDAMTIANGCLEIAAGHHTRGLIGEMWRPLGPESLEGVTFRKLETEPGDACFFDAYTPHRSAPNATDLPRRVLYLTYNKASEGDHYETYFEDKRRSYPPDAERPKDQARRYLV